MTLFKKILILLNKMSETDNLKSYIKDIKKAAIVNKKSRAVAS